MPAFDGKPSADKNIRDLRPVGTDEPRAPRITEVFDRPLADHDKLVKLSRASQAKGAKDAGLNYQTFRESMADHSQGADTSDGPEPNRFDKTNSQNTALLRRETDTDEDYASNGYMGTAGYDGDGFDGDDGKNAGPKEYKARRGRVIPTPHQFDPGSL